MKAKITPRFENVIAWLEADSATSPDLDELASVAGLSRHYFHRQFTQTFGVSLQTLMRRVRAHRAAWQLAYRTSMTITDIAFAAGYENSESFSRAFKRQTGVTPSEFRVSPDPGRIAMLASAVRALDSAATNFASIDDANPVVIDFDAVSLAQRLHRGSPRTLMTSVEAFIQWRKACSTPPSKSRTFNIFYSDPADGGQGMFTFGIAAEHGKEIAPNPQGVTATHIPELRCLSWVQRGSDNVLQQRIEQVIAMGGYDWDFNHFPPFIERLRFYPDIAIAEALNRVFLPVRKP